MIIDMSKKFFDRFYEISIDKSVLFTCHKFWLKHLGIVSLSTSARLAYINLNITYAEQVNVYKETANNGCLDDPNENITCYKTEVLYSIRTANVCPLSTYIRTTDGARHHSIHHGHGVCAQGVAGAHTDIRNGHIILPWQCHSHLAVMLTWSKSAVMVSTSFWYFFTSLLSFLNSFIVFFCDLEGFFPPWNEQLCDIGTFLLSINNLQPLIRLYRPRQEEVNRPAPDKQEARSSSCL